MNLPLIAQLLLALIFLVSSISKCLEINDFRSSIREFGIIKNNYLIKTSAFLMIFIEMVTSLLIIFFFQYFFTIVVAICMMLLFIAMLIKVSLEKKEIHCNCFGKSDKPTNKLFAITRNILIIALTIFAWKYRTDNHQFLISEKMMLFTILLNFAWFVVLVKEHWYRRRKVVYA